MTDLELQKNVAQASLQWFEITIGQLLPVTKEHISQVSWVKSSIAPFLQNQPVLYHTTLLWIHSTVYVGRESRFQ